MLKGIDHDNKKVSPLREKSSDCLKSQSGLNLIESLKKRYLLTIWNWYQLILTMKIIIELID